ncbi:MAG: pirin family protein, partial [Actinomycetia bacterium]|nr:pirin family protein [Actinomycetes bacterium]
MADLRVMRSKERFRTERDGIRTDHSFSFGDHYDPTNLGFGDLTAVNDERIAPGCGYGMHRHRDAEIVTWVLDGALAHADSAGNAGTITRGGIQRMNAGDGVEHCERNAFGDADLRFIQMWLRSDREGAPVYQQARGADARAEGAWVLAASADPGDGAAIDIATDGARLWIARPGAGEPLAVPPGDLRHLHLVRGAVVVDGEHRLEAGDVLRRNGSAEHTLVADSPSEILLWA